MMDIPAERVLILNFGSQYTQLIARRVREAKVYCEVHPYNFSDDSIRQFAPKAIILSGGPESVTTAPNVNVSQFIFDLGVPILGICYGMQTMAQQLGAKVSTTQKREFGHATIKVHSPTLLLDHLDITTKQDNYKVWMSHGDKVDCLPDRFKVIASTDNTPIAAMADEQRKLYGLQFHPEVTQTTQGQTIIQKFLYDIAGCQTLWTAENITDTMIKSIAAQVQDEQVLLALSGGVDSSVMAIVLHQALGDQLICVFVDNGLLRLNEAEEVIQNFQRLNIPIEHIKAQDRFINALAGCSDAEKKRKIIGHEFIKVFEEHSISLKEKYQNIKWLAQGTIYSDVIESGGSQNSNAHVIKSHHNVGGLPENMDLKLLEPCKELFKDEVRAIGHKLGMPEDILQRHPFPGPGLGIRIIGEIKVEYLEILRQADDIFIRSLKQQQLYHTVSQAFSVFLPIQSVGVMGDTRTYEYVIALRAVTTVDFMTVQAAQLPYPFLNHVASKIINEVKGISRVTYDISNKPPATIEWE